MQPEDREHPHTEKGDQLGDRVQLLLTNVNVRVRESLLAVPLQRGLERGRLPPLPTVVVGGVERARGDGYDDFSGAWVCCRSGGQK
jgi:hypothetical protein